MFWTKTETFTALLHVKSFAIVIFRWSLINYNQNETYSKILDIQKSFKQKAVIPIKAHEFCKPTELVSLHKKKSCGCGQSVSVLSAGMKIYLRLSWAFFFCSKYWTFNSWKGWFIVLSNRIENHHFFADLFFHQRRLSSRFRRHMSSIRHSLDLSHMQQILMSFIIENKSQPLGRIPEVLPKYTSAVAKQRFYPFP